MVNTGAETVRLDRLGIVVTTGPDWVGWATRAGAEASVAALPCRVGDPVVGFSLLQGELRGVGAELELGPLTLPPSGQHVVRLRGETYVSAREFARGRHELLPRWGWIEAGDEARVHHPDLAVVEHNSLIGLGDPNDPEPGDEGLPDPDTSVLAGDPGDTARLVLAGPRGLVDIAVGLAPPLELLVDHFVAAGERYWPSGRQGIRIPSAAAALLVQRQLASQSRGGRPADDWVEAVEGSCARIEEPTSTFAVALLARQAVLTGDAELAERATDGCRRPDWSDTGLALVAPEVLAARQLIGLDPTLPVRTQHDLTQHDLTQHELGDDHGAQLQQLGARWGLGLHGDQLASEDLVADARRLAGAGMRALLRRPRPRQWACGHDELLHRHDRRVRHRLWHSITEPTDDPNRAPGVADALAWLVLAPGA